MKGVRRTAAVIFALIVFFAMLSSAVTVIAHGDHQCTGTGCRECRVIWAAAQNARALGVVLTAVFLALTALRVGMVRRLKDSVIEEIVSNEGA
ncbi:MAG: hypothetical protein IIZ55_03300 [Firmicutes bacterium]|nr:hypothetical protein [Bacillota bacterium]